MGFECFSGIDGFGVQVGEIDFGGVGLFVFYDLSHILFNHAEESILLAHGQGLVFFVQTTRSVVR